MDQRLKPGISGFDRALLNLVGEDNFVKHWRTHREDQLSWKTISASRRICAGQANQTHSLALFAISVCVTKARCSEICVDAVAIEEADPTEPLLLFLPLACHGAFSARKMPISAIIFGAVVLQDQVSRSWAILGAFRQYS